MKIHFATLIPGELRTTPGAGVLILIAADLTNDALANRLSIG